CPITGAASTSLPTFAVQRCAPVSASSATTSPSRLPTTTRPSPTPGPPDRGSSLSWCQAPCPVCRSSAVTPPSSAAAYTRPPSTAGAWRAPTRPSPLPTLADHSRCGVAVAVNVVSSAGFSASSSLPPNQPLSVLQPASRSSMQAA